jgi:leader peptidase (prepilin peptidase)/N-methyltransferase
VSLILVAAKIKGRKDFIPFGPFIAAAALIVIFYGSNILQIYLHNVL